VYYSLRKEKYGLPRFGSCLPHLAQVYLWPHLAQVCFGASVPHLAQVCFWRKCSQRNN